MLLYEEIQQQPEVLSTLLEERWEDIQEIAKKIGKPAGLFIAARGTSDNAARYGKYVWGAFNSIPVSLATPSLFSIYHQPPNLKSQLVIGISQSGESPDLLAVLQEAKQQGAPTLAITNHVSSPLADTADHIINIQAGKEQAVAATKTYTAQLMAIAMLSAAWNQTSNQHSDLKKVPAFAASALELEKPIAEFAPRYRYMDQCVVLGRGFNYATAYEWSLKLKELCYVVAQPYSSADFQHGPIALVTGGFPVFAVAPHGQVFSEMSGLLRRLKEQQQAELFVISNDAGLLETADCAVPLPRQVPEWLSPLIGIIPAQLFCYHLTLLKGIDPDAPRGLSKVTRTR